MFSSAQSVHQDLTTEVNLHNATHPGWQDLPLPVRSGCVTLMPYHTDGHVAWRACPIISALGFHLARNVYGRWRLLFTSFSAARYVMEV